MSEFLFFHTTILFFTIGLCYMLLLLFDTIYCYFLFLNLIKYFTLYLLYILLRCNGCLLRSVLILFYI